MFKKGNKIESLRSADNYVEVKVENIRKVQKTLDVVTKNVPGEGYILGKVSTEQNALRISGPESAVELVDKAVVNFDLANATEEEITTSVFESHADEIFEEAENRLHAQKAVLVKLLGE